MPVFLLPLLSGVLPTATASAQEWTPKARPVVERTLQLSGTANDVVVAAFRAYGIHAIISPTLSIAKPIDLNVGDADLTTTAEVLSAMLHCIFVPFGETAVIVMEDTSERRARFVPQEQVRFNVPELTTEKQREEIRKLSREVFSADASIAATAISVRAKPEDLEDIQETVEGLYQGEAQVLLRVKTYSVSRSRNREVGVAPPTKFSIFNITSEAENLLNNNSSVVQELIDEGLAKAGDTLTIAELLIAAGYGGTSVLSSSSLYFGGGYSATGVQFGSIAASASISDSKTRILRSTVMHLAEGEPGSFRLGQRYPVLTAKTTTLSTSSSTTSTPSISYEDLGLTLEATARVDQDDEVTLQLRQIIRSLHGTSLNGIPILDSQEVSSDLRVKTGETVILVSDLSSTESRVIQGLASVMPTDNATGIDASQLIITVTPIVTRRAPHRTGIGHVLPPQNK